MYFNFPVSKLYFSKYNQLKIDLSNVLTYRILTNQIYSGLLVIQLYYHQIDNNIDKVN